MPRRADQGGTGSSDSGLDLATLAITAASSAAAAYVCSKIWAPGTLASAAMTPVIIALIKEALRKPTQAVAAAVPVPTRRGTTGQERVVWLDGLDETLQHAPPPPMPPPTEHSPEGPVRVYSTRTRRLRWRLAVITGLLGFVICLVLYTVPELITGSSAGRSGSQTTFFGGSSGQHKRSSDTSTTTSTQTTPAQTTPTTTTTTTVTTPGQTVTVPAPTSTTPAPGTGTSTNPAAGTETQPPASTPPTTPAAPPAQTTPGQPAP